MIKYTPQKQQNQPKRNKKINLTNRHKNLKYKYIIGTTN